MAVECSPGNDSACLVHSGGHPGYGCTFQATWVRVLRALTAGHTRSDSSTAYARTVPVAGLVSFPDPFLLQWSENEPMAGRARGGAARVNK